MTRDAYLSKPTNPRLTHTTSEVKLVFSTLVTRVPNVTGTPDSHFVDSLRLLTAEDGYWVATIRVLLKIIGLFCKRAL